MRWGRRLAEHLPGGCHDPISIPPSIVPPTKATSNAAYVPHPEQSPVPFAISKGTVARVGAFTNRKAVAPFSLSRISTGIDFQLPTAIQTIYGFRSTNLEYLICVKARSQHAALRLDDPRAAIFPVRVNFRGGADVVMGSL